MLPGVLIIDDDPGFADLLGSVCELGGYYHEAAASARAAWSALARRRFALALVDVHLGAADGKELASAIKARTPPPGPRIILLSADGDPLQESDALGCCGADDFILKPDGRQEGWALRILARIRRLVDSRAGAPARLCAGGLCLDLLTREISLSGAAASAPLPPRQFALMKLFLERPGDLLSKDDILAEVWRGRRPNPNALEKEIGRLRARLGGAGRALIRSVPGAGYLLRAPDEEEGGSQ